MARLYLIHCVANGEYFYKIGITYLAIKRRFRLKKIGYEFELMHFIESYNAEYIYDLEKALARRLKDFAYLTTKDFTGRTECYKFDSISVFMEALIVVTNK